MYTGRGGKGKGLEVRKWEWSTSKDIIICIFCVVVSFVLDEQIEMQLLY